MLKSLMHTKERRSHSPDGIGVRLLQNCARQLCGIISFIFQCSFLQREVPKIWKDSIVVPVAKVRNPKSLNDYRSVSLTSLTMKAFENSDVKVILIKGHQRAFLLRKLSSFNIAKSLLKMFYSSCMRVRPYLCSYLLVWEPTIIKNMLRKTVRMILKSLAVI